MGSRCHYPFSDRGGVRAHLFALPSTASQTLHRQQITASPAAEFVKSIPHVHTGGV